MKKLTVALQNCYGIKTLSHEFDFSSRKAFSIYAPNGTMKSSFAATFKDIAEGASPKDRIFPARVSRCSITDEAGKALSKEAVLVLEPYDEFFGHNQKTSTLLVNNKLRKEFESLSAEIGKSKDAFLKAMKTQSGSKKDLGREVTLAFTKSDSEEAFFEALIRIEGELKDQKDTPFADVSYDTIFDEKVLTALAGKGIKTALTNYVKRYNDLLSSSTYFKKGVFEYYNAGQVAKTLATNGFFDAKHTVQLNASKNVVVDTQKQLEELVANEFGSITKDEELKKQFASIKKSLETNVTLRDFHSYVCAHEHLLPELDNLDLFKEKIWKSYIKKHESLYTELLGHFQKVKARRKEIEEEARKERTQWEAAIELFNERFFVPFVLVAKNKVNVLLGSDEILDLGYTFKDGTDEAPIERDTLLKSLSTGEKKALYILNIIFEVEVRRQAKIETLFVVDDIADSFDYKNKYAIIQYLQEISNDPLFKLILLTHNFDFFRTVAGRIANYSGCLMVTKSATGIVLGQATGFKNVFVNDWKAGFYSNGKKRIASIPFMRNLIEYTVGDEHADYLTLTSLLHWKTDSASITQGTLDSIFVRLFEGAGSHAEPHANVFDLIRDEANDCLTAADGANFENKVVLSIAIRLFADKYMVDKIANPSFVAQINTNQTWALLNEFKKMHSSATQAIKVLGNVSLMTPENIHLNAFMYEPILDMSDEHLRKLYRDVLALT